MCVLITHHCKYGDSFPRMSPQIFKNRDVFKQEDAVTGL